MAQAGYTPISLYYSATASAVPIAGNLVAGELALNTNDGKLYYKDSGGVVQLLASKGATAPGGSTTQIQYNNAGAFAGSAGFTYTSGTSTLTVPTAIFSGTGAVTLPVGTTGQQPGTPTVGMIRYNSTTNTFEGYSGASPTWGAIGGGAPAVTDFTAGAGQTVFTLNYVVGNLEVYRNGIKLGISDFTATNGTSFTLATGAVAGDLIEAVTFTGTVTPGGVTSISTGTGIVASGSTGAVTLTLGTLGNNRVWYGNSTGVASTSANLTFDGTTLGTVNDATISGLTVGKGGGALVGNTVLGNGAGAATMTTISNTLVGYQAGAANTAGYAIDAFGWGALAQNTTGVANSAHGQAALTANTTGSSNAAFGYSALGSNTTGSFNVAMGQYALNASNGNSNTALGFYALQVNTASNNTAVGYQAGYTNSTGINNVFIGHTAGYTCNSSSNLMIGLGAGYFTTSGNYNTFVGTQGSTGNAAGAFITSGSYNTILGSFTGNQGGLDIRTASNYIVLSDGAGNPRGIFDSAGNFLVGTTAAQGGSPSDGVGITLFAGANAGAAEFVRSSVSGSGAAVLYISSAQSGAQNLVQFNSGGAGVGGIVFNGTNVVYNTSSDQRLKENIVDAPSAIDKITAVQVRSYDWRSTGAHTEFGVIAQELHVVAPECVTAGDDGEEIETTWGIDLSGLIPALTKAIQEQQAMIMSQATLIESQAADIAALKAKVGI